MPQPQPDSPYGVATNNWPGGDVPILIAKSGGVPPGHLRPGFCTACATIQAFSALGLDAVPVPWILAAVVLAHGSWLALLRDHVSFDLAEYYRARHTLRA